MSDPAVDVFTQGALFTIDDYGIPRYHGTTYEDDVNAWEECRRRSNGISWAAAAVAASIDRRSGRRQIEDTGRTELAEFARENQVGREHVRDVARVYRWFADEDEGKRGIDTPLCERTGFLIAQTRLVFSHFLWAAKLCDTPADALAAVQEAHDAEESANEMFRRLRKDRHKKQIKAASERAKALGLYQVLVADPPWQYDNAGFEQSAESKYPTLSVEAICALPETDPAFPTRTTHGVIFLWTTAPMLREGLQVLKA